MSSHLLFKLYSVAVLKARVMGSNVDLMFDDVDFTIDGGESQVLTIKYVDWILGYVYGFDFLTFRGNAFCVKSAFWLFLLSILGNYQVDCWGIIC